jgi:hypothetical protein
VGGEVRSKVRVNFSVQGGAVTDTSEEIFVSFPFQATRRGNLKSVSNATAVHSRVLLSAILFNRLWKNLARVGKAWEFAEDILPIVNNTHNVHCR